MKYLHTMVRARDLDETLDFYCNKLGLVEVNRHDSEGGRFTLVFLAAPDDAEAARSGQSPLLEITWNWDPEQYEAGRNFGHLAYRVSDIYATCERLASHGVTINRPPRGWSYGLYTLPGRHLHRVVAGRRSPAAQRTLAVDGKYRQLVAAADAAGR